MIKMNPMAPLMGHPAMLTPFPIECVGVVADAGTAGGGASNTKPWMLAAGALVVGVTAAAAVAWHSASADGDAPEQAMTNSAAKPTQQPKNTAPVAQRQAPVRQQTAAQAPVCRQCGTVESVQAVTQKGEGSGLGAVAGGVVGGALGSQVGKGDGRTAMTVLGAIGGGLAGNEVEKRAKSVTHYRVTLKMEDGSVQTVDQAQPPSVGQRVRVEGQTLQPLPRQG